MNPIETKSTPEGFLDLTGTRQFAGNPGVSTLYKWMSEGAFPKPYTTGPNRRGWKISDLTAWRDSLPQAEYRTKAAT